MRLILARDEHTTSGYDLALVTTDRTAAPHPAGRPPGTRPHPPRPRRRGSRIAKITRPRWPNRVLAATLAGDEPRQLRLTWTVDGQARRELETELFGKRILVTSRDDWPVPEVVAGYRSQSGAEAGFRQLKDPRVVSFSPMHHWTDQKIRVHVSYRVTALAVAHLMRRQARQHGLDRSVRVLLSELAAIQETVLLYPSTGGRPRARRMLTELTMTQRRLYEIFGFDRYGQFGIAS